MMTLWSARRSRTSHARSGVRPRELAEPVSTSTLTGVLVVCCWWRCARLRQVSVQKRAGRPVGAGGSGVEGVAAVFTSFFGVAAP